jgi:hypothetical protein
MCYFEDDFGCASFMARVDNGNEYILLSKSGSFLGMSERLYAHCFEHFIAAGISLFFIKNRFYYNFVLF